jgi:hypothetical protein
VGLSFSQVGEFQGNGAGSQLLKLQFNLPKPEANIVELYRLPHQSGAPLILSTPRLAIQQS